jgi:acetyltransferase
MRIEAAQFENYRADLVAILFDAVAHGASLGFLASISAAEANSYWSDVQAAMAGGSRLLFVATEGGRAIGTVQMDMCMKKNGINRAEVQKLMVHSSARGKGVARALMRELEGEALERQRGLLFLDTEAGSGAEPFYRAVGYTFLGGLPEYACSPEGEWRANAIYYKTLFLRHRPNDSF